MIVEDPNVIYLGYVLGLVGVFGIGFEFIALKIPNFIEKFSLSELRKIFLSFLNSWQLGFILMFIATHYLHGILGDMLLFFGLGIAIPDLPKRFRRYYKYILAIIMISGVLPSWLVEFFRGLEPEEGSGETVHGGEEESSKELEKESIEWKEPDYLGEGNE